MRSFFVCCIVSVICSAAVADHIENLQNRAIANGRSDAAHWGAEPDNYTHWGSHSNRLVPVYAFGTKGAGRRIDLDSYTGANSPYRNANYVRRLYGKVPEGSVHPHAEYMDQINIFSIQEAARLAGKKNIFLVVFDGMDWDTTRAASIHNLGNVAYDQGRGSGTHFQDYTANDTTQFAFMVTSPHNEGTRTDVNQQTVTNPGGSRSGGYDPNRGGPTPWTRGSEAEYLIGKPDTADAYTDSASSATSMNAGVKTFNGAINIRPDGRMLLTVAHRAQREGKAVGSVTSVPISHATPAATYAHNVTRNDYQDLTRDLLGLPSISHPTTALPGMDVVIGCGFGQERDEDNNQGENFIPGNRYLTKQDLESIDVANGGRYVVSVRTSGMSGAQRLQAAANEAAQTEKRLFGFYGGAHLPYATADGDYHPAVGRGNDAEVYSDAEIDENPTLADMTQAALTVLEKNPQGLWLMVESGDVDWANHDNNLDNSIGAVNSGDAAVKVITEWVEANSNWNESVLIVTADHGHYLFLDRPEMLVSP